jgi:hypothetical protein
MVSDAYMIILYYKTKRPGTAKALLGMVGANLVFQLVVVTGKCHNMKKDKWRTILLEMLAVVAFVKPGVDAHRVASGAEEAPGSPMTPLMRPVAIASIIGLNHVYSRSSSPRAG